MTELMHPHREHPDRAGSDENNNPRQDEGDGEAEYPKNEFLTIFLTGLQFRFLFGSKGRGLERIDFRNKLPKDNSAAEALRSLRRVLELASRTHHGRIIPVRKIAL